MLNSTKFDNLIEAAVNKRANEITPSKDMFDKINAQINFSEESIYMKFKRNRSLKLIAVTCCMLMLISATVYAAIENYIGSSQYNEAFKTFPSAQQVQSAVKFLPKYVESFKNGFTFKRSSIGKNTTEDNEKKTYKANGIAFEYAKKGIDGEITLDAQEVVKGVITSADIDEGCEDIDISNGIHGKYLSYMNKCVPADYKLTEQDKMDEKSGKYVFSFGADKTTIQHVQSISWKQDNISYSMVCFNDEITKAELLKMAAEIIGK